MAVGPIIPDRVTPAKPVARYVPSYASSTGKTTAAVNKGNAAAVKAGLVPKPTNVTKGVGSSSKTGSIEKKTSTKTPVTQVVTDPVKTLEGELPLGQALDIEQLTGAYSAGAALRQFQREQANRQLTDALGEIDRAAIEGYKGIANDYAARGMARSGGFMGAESEAMANKTRADLQSRQAVADFLQQLDLQATADLKNLGTSQQKIIADYLAGKFAPAIGG